MVYCNAQITDEGILFPQCPIQQCPISSLKWLIFLVILQQVNFKFQRLLCIIWCIYIMAYFTKLPSKNWRAQISWYDADGKRRYKSKAGFATKRQAQEWANKMEVAKVSPSAKKYPRNESWVLKNMFFLVPLISDWAETC